MTDCKFHLLPVLFKLNTVSAPGQGRRRERESRPGGNKNKKLSFESRVGDGAKGLQTPTSWLLSPVKMIEVF